MQSTRTSLPQAQRRTPRRPGTAWLVLGALSLIHCGGSVAPLDGSDVDAADAQTPVDGAPMLAPLEIEVTDRSRMLGTASQRSFSSPNYVVATFATREASHETFYVHEFDPASRAVTLRGRFFLRVGVAENSIGPSGVAANRTVAVAFRRAVYDTTANNWGTRTAWHVFSDSGEVEFDQSVIPYRTSTVDTNVPPAIIADGPSTFLIVDVDARGDVHRTSVNFNGDMLSSTVVPLTLSDAERRSLAERTLRVVAQSNNAYVIFEHQSQLRTLRVDGTNAELLPSLDLSPGLSANQLVACANTEQPLSLAFNQRSSQSSQTFFAFTDAPSRMPWTTTTVDFGAQGTNLWCAGSDGWIATRHTAETRSSGTELVLSQAGQLRRCPSTPAVGRAGVSNSDAVTLGFNNTGNDFSVVAQEYGGRITLFPYYLRACLP